MFCFEKRRKIHLNVINGRLKILKKMSEEATEVITKEQLVNENNSIIAYLQDDEIKELVDAICRYNSNQILTKLNELKEILGNEKGEMIEEHIQVIRSASELMNINYQIGNVRDSLFSLKEPLKVLSDEFKEIINHCITEIDEILSNEETREHFQEKNDQLSDIIEKERTKYKEHEFDEFYGIFLDFKHATQVLSTLCTLHDKLAEFHNHLVIVFNYHDEEKPSPFVETKWSIAPKSKKIKSHHNTTLASIPTRNEAKLSHLSPYYKLESLIKENETLRKNLNRKSMEVNPVAALELMKENEKLKERLAQLQTQMTSASLKMKQKEKK